MSSNSKFTISVLFLILLLFVSFDISGQSKQDKIDTIVSTFKIAEMPQMQYKYRIERLKYIVTGKDSVKLINLESELNKEDILKVIYSAFDEHLSTKEVDDIFNFMQSSAYEKMFVQSKIYKALEKHYSYIDEEVDRITAGLDESIQKSKPGFDPIPVDRVDGLYLTEYSTHNTQTKEIVLHNSPSFTPSDMLEIKKVSYDDKPSEINILFTKEAARELYLLTENNKGKPLAIVFGNKIVAMPYIIDAIVNGKVSITGNFTEKELDEMIARLKDKEYARSLETNK